MEENLTEFQKNFLKVVDSWVGTPFLHANSRKKVGCDCLGLIRGILKEIDRYPKKIQIPYYPKNFPVAATETLLVDEIKKYFPLIIDDEFAISNIVVIKRGRFPTHLAFFVGDNKIVHSLPPHGVIKGTFDHDLREKCVGRFDIR